MSDKDPKGDNARFDVHQTDPAQLQKMKSEIEKDLGLQASKVLWECTECGNEVKSATRPGRCEKCGAYGKFTIVSDGGSFA